MIIWQGLLTYVGGGHRIIILAAEAYTPSESSRDLDTIGGRR